MHSGPTLPVPSLPLASHRQHDDRVDIGYEAIERDIAARATPNDQFALAALHRATDERAVRQDLHRLDDFSNALGRVFDFELGEVIE